MWAAALSSLKIQWKFKILLRGSYVGKQDYVCPHISIPGDLCHYFLFWSEQNDALKIAV